VVGFWLHCVRIQWLTLRDLQATKYLGGHSDLLGGVLVVNTVEEWNQVIRLN